MDSHDCSLVFHFATPNLGILVILKQFQDDEVR